MDSAFQLVRRNRQGSQNEDLDRDVEHISGNESVLSVNFVVDFGLLKINAPDNKYQIYSDKYDPKTFHISTEFPGISVYYNNKPLDYGSFKILDFCCGSGLDDPHNRSLPHPPHVEDTRKRASTGDDSGIPFKSLRNRPPAQLPHGSRTQKNFRKSVLIRKIPKFEENEEPPPIPERPAAKTKVTKKEDDIVIGPYIPPDRLTDITGKTESTLRAEKSYIGNHTGSFAEALLKKETNKYIVRWDYDADYYVVNFISREQDSISFFYENGEIHLTDSTYANTDVFNDFAEFKERNFKGCSPLTEFTHPLYVGTTITSLEDLLISITDSIYMKSNNGGAG